MKGRNKEGRKEGERERINISRWEKIKKMEEKRRKSEKNRKTEEDEKKNEKNETMAKK